MRAELRLWRRLGRPVAIMGLVIITATIALTAINAIGIRIVGDVVTWQRWLHVHAWFFMAWRLMLYAVIACGWQRMHQRVRRRDDSAEIRRRLRRAGIGAVLAISTIEVTTLLHSI
ncbi:hypothetical protein [Burkholderia pseudomallei]|uniref:hypothetical protein n=1 Tax=Burkholderia pseudomallei TaxID=28450 RepID=UPI0005DADBF5|nr:hypothetical protein [Burkholderia pseudomallei]CAJ3172660.1 Uncharacterised protein [Burkholderia pseudomallei]CAJ9801325.1 Uncharacterised protein [Burkholderia pseudomallei]CFL24183.1 Uncharacterised protein [Burkholderia pseudomallei]